MTVGLQCSENETPNSHGLPIKLVELVQLSIKLVQQQPTMSKFLQPALVGRLQRIET